VTYTLPQTFIDKMFGDKESEYELYLSMADDGNGNDTTTGKPLKTFDEWLSS